MNAVEIEEAISALAAAPFDPQEFPYAFLEAFGNKETTIKRLKSGNTNQSDIGGVLQRNNIHIKVSPEGEVSETLKALRNSPATVRQKARFILATDGISFLAESLIEDCEPLACDYPDFPNYFGFFLPLAGITTVRQIRENAFDIQATGRLNKLYVELLRENPDWDTVARRDELNHFFARLIFCFFAEDTGIFHGEGLFTRTVEQMSDRNSSNTHEVITEIFRAMNVPQNKETRAKEKVRPFADTFPYVNGGLFSGSLDVPRFTKAARLYLIGVGYLNWTKINPDIFGSMIQAVADDEERGSLGMHYTSVPNILKVLNPLFLDDLRNQLQQAGDNSRKLLNLRNRMARIRVFDPACGSGNFLVIAYKEMRAIEAEINLRRGEDHRASEIPLTNFRGIELKSFSAEIARLALIIAEYQSDVLYRGQREALLEFLPLDKENWITCGNALRLDWLSICPPTGKNVDIVRSDLFEAVDQTEMDFANEGGETYICGNPPYLGSTWQSSQQKEELKAIFGKYISNWKSLDYVTAWFLKAAEYGCHTQTTAAFVTTNSICQGQQVPILWPLIFSSGHSITFAHTSFKWANLASNNAGVTVAIVGISKINGSSRSLYSLNEQAETVARDAPNINAYLVPAQNIIIEKRSKPLNPDLAEMDFGNKPVDGGHLFFNFHELASIGLTPTQRKRFIRQIYGSAELIRGLVRYCIWIGDSKVGEVSEIPSIRNRLKAIQDFRQKSDKEATIKLASHPHRFAETRQIGNEIVTIIPSVSSESREYLPVGYENSETIVSNAAFALYDAPLWNMAIIASRIHLVWIGTVCGKLETRYRYSNTLGWNTFPLPPLSEQNKTDLTRCAEDILLAREAKFPATIADLYDPDNKDKYPDLFAAHDRNDEVLERIYIGRRFKNDTERLEKLFDLYTRMAADQPAPRRSPRGKR